MVKVSVIVPVYNVEKFVEQTLESLVDQTFQDYEVLVLNDGSTDNSAKIVERFCSTRLNFKYYTHDNKGLGPTRNRGIDLAKGEYITFVDSDDTLPNNMLEVLFNKINDSNSDVVCGETSLTFSNKSSKLVKSFDDINDISNVQSNYKQFINKYFLPKIYSYSAWGKMYKREVIVANNIHFADNKKIFAEDLYFQLQLLQVVKKVSFVNEVSYFYFQREDSIMNSYKPNLFERQINLNFAFDNFMKKNETNQQLSNLLVFESLTTEAINLISSGQTKNEYLRKLNGILGDEYVYKSVLGLNNIHSYELIDKQSKKIFIKMFSRLIENRKQSLALNALYYVYKNKRLM